MARKNIESSLANLGQSLLSAYETGSRLKDRQEDRAMRRQQYRDQRSSSAGQQRLQQRKLGLEERKLGLAEKKLGFDEKRREELAELMFNEKKVNYDLKRMKAGQLSDEIASDYLLGAAGLTGSSKDKTPTQIKNFAAGYLNIVKKKTGKDEYKAEEVDIAMSPEGLVMSRTVDGKEEVIETIPKQFIDQVRQRRSAGKGQQAQLGPGFEGAQVDPVTKMITRRNPQTNRPEIFNKTLGTWQEQVAPRDMPKARGLATQIGREAEKGTFPFRAGIPFVGEGIWEGVTSQKKMEELQLQLFDAGVDSITMENKKGNVKNVDVEDIGDEYKKGYRPARQGARTIQSGGLAAQGTSDMVEIRDPRGNLRRVPKNRVQEFLDAGGELVE